MTRFRLICACLWFTCPLSALAMDPHTDDVPDVVKGITAREINGHLRFLASDLLKGRDTASPESRLAAEYLAGHLVGAGAEPLGETSPRGRTYFQRFPLEVVTPREEGTDLTLMLELPGSKQTISCRLGNDFQVFPFGLIPGEIEAQVVFAGYGRVDSARSLDDYAGLDVKNRFVLVYDGEPDAGESKSSTAAIGSQSASNPFSKLESARKNGAIGLLVIQPPGRDSQASSESFNVRNLGFGRPRISLGSTPINQPILRVTGSSRDFLIKAQSLTADTKPGLRGEGGVRARFRFNATRERKEDRNVLGFFEGSDPEKKKELVVFSAHYDHVGVNEAGEIFNGSDDNASGTSTLLEIAQAFGQGPRPSRSVAFLWVSGEEKGLLGSHWFADHSTLPEGYKIVADINLDMVSRNDPRAVGVTPSPSHGDYNSLIPAAQSSCKAEGMQVVFDADQFYHRTDSYSFAQKGVPVIFFFAGVHADYHKPTDDFEKADIEKAARVARAAYRLGWSVAQGKEAPKKIKPETKSNESQTANHAS